MGWAGAFQDPVAYRLLIAGPGIQVSCLRSRSPGSCRAFCFALGCGEELAHMESLLLPRAVLSAL